MKYKIKPSGDGVTFKLTLTIECKEDHTILHDDVAIKIAESGDFIRDVYLAGRGDTQTKKGTVILSDNAEVSHDAKRRCEHRLVSPFALFAGATYYPAPGWRGHCGQFDTIEAAQKEGERIAEESFGWWQVVDLRKLEIVAGEGSGHTGLFGEVPAGNEREQEQ